MLRPLFSLALTLALAVGAHAAQAQTPPPTDVDHLARRGLHILCKGDTKGPTVVFEAGLRQYPANATYGKAQAAIALFARVCTYDRAGLGWSEPDPRPRVYPAMVLDLHRLLAAARLEGPYVLVGHVVA